jgi:NAD(P)-dependent dehydrogenase (short-subunit alcohol dehydrogenase family)
MLPSESAKRNPVWFVTGASSGFGLAVSCAVLKHGHRLVASARNPHDLQHLVDPAGDRALALPLDVTDATAARKAMQAAIAHFGRVDVVFNNAGYGHVGAIEELGDDELRRQLDVNLLGVINVTRAALPHMRKQRSGHLVQMSSLNGVEGLAGAAYYAASKFAIEGFSETLASEVAHLGIKVTIVEPGPFRTRFLNDESAKWSPPIGDYDQSVGKSRETLREMDGRQPGDPDRAALAIVQAVESDKPPLRLPLGKIALDHIRAVLGNRLKDLETWSAVGAGADFPSDAAAGEAVAPQGDGQRAHVSLIRRAYDAFNARRVEAGLALMDPEVDWPNVPQGGFVHGQDQLRSHWREQFAQADPHVDVTDIRQTSDGRVEADVRQIVRRLDGAKLSDDRLVHVFTIANDRIKRMEVKSRA